MVGGKYKILSLLGRGGVGSVYLVEHVFLKQQLALKVLDGKQVLDDAQVRRFQQEAKAAFSLDHPNLVKVQDYGVLESDQPYLVMEYIQGVNLTQFMKEHGALKPQLAAVIFAQLCAGMAHAHRKSVIHRDIKPSNIMLVESVMPGTPGSAKIVDFGIAKLTRDEDGEIQSLTRTGEIFGSPLYMSPEQCAGGKIDQRTDLYSLGCAMFESLTGMPPHVGANALSTMIMHVDEKAPRLSDKSIADFPEKLERIVDKLLKKDPSERYQNFDDVAVDLTNLYSQGLHTQPASEPKKVQPIRAKSDEIAPTSGRKIQFSLVRLSLCLGLAAVVSSLATAGFVLSTRSVGVKKATRANAQNAGVTQHPNADSGNSSSVNADSAGELPVDEVDKVVNRDAIIKDKFSAARKIASEIETTGRFKGMRKFVFPKISIGFVIDDSKKKRPAQDTQYFSPDVPLTLAVGGYNLEAFNHPEVFQKIAPNEFLHLTITAPADQNVNDDTSLPYQEEASKTASILAAFASSDRLATLELSGLSLSKDVLDSMDRMSGLKSFSIFSPPTVDFSGRKHEVFERLADVAIVTVPKPTEIIRQLYGSRHLTHLLIILSKPVPNYLAGLGSCPKLELVSLQGGAADLSWQKDLQEIRSMRVLRLSNIPLSAEQVQGLLDKCSQLRELHLVGNLYSTLKQSGRFAKNEKVQFESTD
ncbi:MAG: serine/threonine protein kinase [Cyanobacteria bacterium SZAS LIN-5]|nr:serine/threonine protein kinase [Cyanobacteria bacterium SZAS LIN-5]